MRGSELSEGYSYGVAQRESLLAARRWTAVPSDSGAGEESPEQVAMRVYTKYSTLTGPERDSAADYIAGNGVDEFFNIIMTAGLQSRYSEQFCKEARQHLDRLDLKAALTKLAKDASESAGKGATANDGGSTGSSANISVSAKDGSETARIVARFRALAHDLGFGSDEFARSFCPEKAGERAEQKAEFLKRAVLPWSTEKLKAQVEAEPFLNLCLLTYLQCRTTFLDDCVTRFAEQFQGADFNVVVLGAGYDMRLHRLAVDGACKLLEIDAAATQRQKRKLMAENRIAERPAITYVECDFTAESWLAVAVSAGGLDVAKPTMIVWEGVTYYLPQTVVEETMEIVAKSFSGPCAIAFDYYSSKIIEKYAEHMKKAKEPLLFGVEPDEMVAMVQKAGLSVMDHPTLFEVSSWSLPVNEKGESLGTAGKHEFFMLAANKHFPALT